MFNATRTIVLIGLLGPFSSVRGASADPPTDFAYRYWDTAAPAPSGDCPGMLEFRLAGEGVDLVHGPFAVVQTNCGDFSNWPPVAVVRDAALTFTFVDGSTVGHLIEEAVQYLDVANCPLRLEENQAHGVITGGTGRFAGAQGTIRGVFGKGLSDCSSGDGFVWSVSHVDGD